ncbi:chemotaxis protein [Synechococcus sp. AH-707-M23]|nr:chemotaxis protein [Synechococcus sp. AH-707-M23]
MTQSVSFRITRTAEDVAETLNALSQRLIKLENRLESLELQLERQSSEVNTMPADEMDRLDGVDRLLTDCKDLLLRSEPQWVDPPSSVMSSEQDLAA